MESTRILGSDFTAWERAAQAFMTTDTSPKLCSRVFKIGGVEYRLAGMDKGAGTELQPFSARSAKREHHSPSNYLPFWLVEWQM